MPVDVAATLSLNAREARHRRRARWHFVFSSTSLAGDAQINSYAGLIVFVPEGRPRITLRSSLDPGVCLSICQSVCQSVLLLLHLSPFPARYLFPPVSFSIFYTFLFLSFTQKRGQEITRGECRGFFTLSLKCFFFHSFPLRCLGSPE